MKFFLEIQLGNAEMQTGWHVGTALETVAARVMENDDLALASGEKGKIFDVNGNQVGNWKVTELPDLEELAWEAVGGADVRNGVGHEKYQRAALKGIRAALDALGVTL